MTNTTDPIKWLEAEADASLPRIEKNINLAVKYTIKANRNPEYAQVADEADKKILFYTEKAIRYNNAAADLELFEGYKALIHSFEWCKEILALCCEWMFFVLTLGICDEIGNSQRRN